MAIKEGDVVTLHYTGTTEGEVFDSSEGRDPLTFTVGAQQVIKGFDDAVVGMEKGGKKKFDIKPEEGYGVHHENLVQKVPRDKIPTEQEIKKGMKLQMQMPDGVAILSIIDVNEKEVTVDMNHPLAGKTLTFEIEIVDVKDGSAKE